LREHIRWAKKAKRSQYKAFYHADTVGHSTIEASGKTAPESREQATVRLAEMDAQAPASIQCVGGRILTRIFHSLIGL
jgi:hypothetical protein